MKRNFYPKQIQRKILRKDVLSLNEFERHALNFFARRTYPLGPQVTILEPDIFASDLKGWIDSVRANTTTKIFIRPSGHAAGAS